MDPGARLKEVRSKLGITTREFSAFSKIIADAEGNEEFLISSGWLTQIENEEDALPSIYKLFTLASVYGLSYGDVLALYGVDAKNVKKPIQGMARSEFDRPIYFVDLRNEYACSWCDLVEDKLILLAHPLSPVKTRIFAFAKEAEIIGQVTGVAMRIVLSLTQPGEE